MTLRPGPSERKCTRSPSEIRWLVYDARRVGAEMDVTAALGAKSGAGVVDLDSGNRQGPLRFAAVLSVPVSIWRIRRGDGLSA